MVVRRASWARAYPALERSCGEDHPAGTECEARDSDPCVREADTAEREREVGDSGGVSGFGGGFAWLDESAFVGEDDGLGAVVEVELGEDACDVRFDGGVADDEFAGDLCV